MAIRKSMEREFVVSGPRTDWIKKCDDALRRGKFTNVIYNSALFQIEANYKKLTVWGEILITLVPAGSDTKINVISTANVDNIFALFQSPNKTIQSAFKGELK